MPNLRSTIKIVKQKVTCTLHMLDIQILGYIWYTHFWICKHIDDDCDYVTKAKERKVLN